MKIKIVAVGNKDEAFIEDRFDDGINIISSDENNKGKTIIIQSLMYALGNDPIFPSSFKYRDYYHFVEYVRDDGKTIKICRMKESFVLKYNNNIHIFDNLSEYKYYINEEQFMIPKIIKDGKKKIVDPIIFYQMFFVGQDNKDTSNIFLKGYYNKKDFMNMIYSYAEIDIIEDSEKNELEIKEMIKSLKIEKKELIKQYKVLKSISNSVAIVFKSNDKIKFEEQLKKIEGIKNSIIKLMKKRNSVLARKTKNEVTLKELRSLNRTLSVGELHCLNCNSKNIGYSTADESYTFDISSKEIRSQILSSIQNKIMAYEEEISSITKQINECQDRLQSLMKVDEISLESLLLLKNDLVGASQADTSVIEIDKKIEELKIILENKVDDSVENKENKDKLNKKLVWEMNQFYKLLDPSGNITYNDLFATKQSVYSGCEETEFYLAKVFALKKVLKHLFPIIIDSFRDGELSSKKEMIVIEEFNKFNDQVIFTATLKDEEIGKYDSNILINHINYIDNKPYKLLTSRYCYEFEGLLGELFINV